MADRAPFLWNQTACPCLGEESVYIYCNLIIDVAKPQPATRAPHPTTMSGTNQSSLVALLQNDDAISDILVRLHNQDPVSAIYQHAENRNVSVDIAVWLAFATSNFLCIQMVEGAHGASNQIIDTRNNTILEGINPPMDLIGPAYAIQANEQNRNAVFSTDREFRRLALLEHLSPSESNHSEVIVFSEPSRLTANGRALQELKKLCSGRSSLVWMVCALGIGVFVFVHSEFSEGNLEQGFKWLFDKAR